MTVKIKQKGSLGSVAEDLFVELFCDTFGPEQSEFLFLQYPVTDIYGTRRSIDFALESENLKIKGKLIELREHQQAALASLQTMRDQGESIALLYHATGTGKTVTAVSDAKRLGKRTL